MDSRMTYKRPIGAVVLRIFCATVICCVPFGCASMGDAPESAEVPAQNPGTAEVPAIQLVSVPPSAGDGSEAPPAALPRFVGLTEPSRFVAEDGAGAAGVLGVRPHMPPEPLSMNPDTGVVDSEASDIVTVGGLIGPPNHPPVENGLTLGPVPDALPEPQIALDVPSGNILSEVAEPDSGNPDIGGGSELDWPVYRAGADEPAIWLASYRMPLPEPPARIAPGEVLLRSGSDRDDGVSRNDATSADNGVAVVNVPEQDSSRHADLAVRATVVSGDRTIESFESAEQPSSAEDDVIRSAIRLSRTGVTVPVLLDGYGWIYLPDETVTGFDFVERETADTGMLFHFRVDEPGNYELAFQQQDSSTGTFARAYVDLLGADASPSRTGGEDPAVHEDTEDGLDVVPSVPELVANARTLFGEERYEESLAIYRDLLDLEDELERYSSDFTRAGLLAEAGSAAYRGRDFDAAARYLLDAMASGAEPRYELFLAAIDSVEAVGNGALLKTHLAAIIEDEVPETREDYLRVARLFDLETEPLAVIDLLEAALDRFASTYRDDVVIFRLAAAYEVESEARNEKLAYALYRRIIDDYPMSALYDDAEARLSYIERHYLNIR